MDVLVARSEDELRSAYEGLRAASCIGCDTETSGLTARTGRLYSVQFSDGELNVLVPVSEGVALGPLTRLLSDAAITKIFHNAKFDLDFLTAHNLGVANVYDTMIAEKVLTRGAQQSSSLADTLYRYYAVDLDKSQRAKFTRSWNGIWTDALVRYALSDVVYLPQLMHDQVAWMEKLGMTAEFDEQMRRLTHETRDAN